MIGPIEVLEPAFGRSPRVDADDGDVVATRVLHTSRRAARTAAVFPVPDDNENVAQIHECPGQRRVCIELAGDTIEYGPGGGRAPERAEVFDGVRR